MISLTNYIFLIYYNFYLDDFALFQVMLMQLHERKIYFQRFTAATSQR